MNHLKTTLFVLVLFGGAQLAYAVNVSKTTSASQHDAEEHLNDNSISGGSEVQGDMDGLTSTDLETAEQTAGLDWQVIGVQWDSLGIAQGSAINSATLTFTVDKAQSATEAGRSTLFRLYAEDINNSADFAATAFNITSRTRTGASVAWGAVGITESVGDKVDISVTALVQEVVDRAGWSANNQLSIFLFPQVYLDNTGGANLPIREFELESYDGAVNDHTDQTLAPKLTVDFVPEPASLTLMGIGGLLLLRRHVA